MFDREKSNGPGYMRFSASLVFESLIAASCWKSPSHSPCMWNWVHAPDGIWEGYNFRIIVVSPAAPSTEALSSPVAGITRQNQLLFHTVGPRAMSGLGGGRTWSPAATHNTDILWIPCKISLLCWWTVIWDLGHLGRGGHYFDGNNFIKSPKKEKYDAWDEALVLTRKPQPKPVSAPGNPPTTCTPNCSLM